jgi:hypothetical protein
MKLVLMLLPIALLVVGLSLAQNDQSGTGSGTATDTGTANASTTGMTGTNETTTTAGMTGTTGMTGTETGTAGTTGVETGLPATAGVAPTGVVGAGVPGVAPAPSGIGAAGVPGVAPAPSGVGAAGVDPAALPVAAAVAPPSLLAGPLTPGIGSFGNVMYPYSYLGIPFDQQQTNVQHTRFQSTTTPAFMPFSNGVTAGYNFVPYTASEQTVEQANNMQDINGGFVKFGTQLQATNTVADNFNTVTRTQAAQNAGSGFLDCPGLAIDLGGNLGPGFGGNACRVFINAPAVGGRQFTGVIDVVRGSGINAPVVTGSFPVLGSSYNPLVNALNQYGYNINSVNPVPGGAVVQWSTQGPVNTVVPQVQQIIGAANIGNGVVGGAAPIGVAPAGVGTPGAVY